MKGLVFQKLAGDRLEILKEWGADPTDYTPDVDIVDPCEWSKEARTKAGPDGLPPVRDPRWANMGLA